MFVRRIELFWVSCHQWKCYYTQFMYRIRRMDWLCFVQGYTFHKCRYQNKRERMSAQKLSPNQSGFFHHSKRGGWVSALCGRFLIWCKINSTPGIVSPFLSAISHNFSSHKAPFQTHSLPKLISPLFFFFWFWRWNVVKERTWAQHSGVTIVTTNSES